MGRYINTALGQRWTDEPLPDTEPERLTYPSRTLQALGRIAGKVDHALAMAGAEPRAKEVGSDAPSLPTFDDHDVQDLAERLAEDRSWLPHGSHVESRAEDNSSPLSRAYGPSYVDRATSVTIPIIGTFTPRELLEQGLVTKGGRWNHVAHEAALKATPGVISGRLIGPRDLMLARQEDARAKYPRLWHA
jgi:hypothetical protein